MPVHRNHGAAYAETPRADELPIPDRATARAQSNDQDKQGRFRPGNRASAKPKTSLVTMACRPPTGLPEEVRARADKAGRRWARTRAQDLLQLYGSLGPGPRGLLAKSAAAASDAVYARFLARLEEEPRMQLDHLKTASQLDERARSHEVFALEMAKREAEARAKQIDPFARFRGEVHDEETGEVKA